MKDSKINYNPEDIRFAVSRAADKTSLSGKKDDNTQPIFIFPDGPNSEDSTVDSSGVDSAQQEFDAANDAATAASDKVATASGKVATASGNVDTASAELSNANAELAAAQSKQVSTGKKDAKGEDIMGPDTAAIAQAQARVRAAQDQLDAAQKELEAANKEYADAKEAEEAAKEQVGNKEETLSAEQEKFQAAQKAAEAAQKEVEAQVLEALEAYAQAEEEYSRTTESQNAQDRGSVTVTLDDEDVLSQRVDADGKPVAAFGLQKDENGKKVTDTTAKSLIKGTYVDENGNPVDLDSNEVNSAAWALYDNNQDNPEFKKAIADSYKAITKQEMPATINAADIPAEVILNADLKDVDQEDLNKFTYQNITSLDYAEGADVTLSKKVDFDSKQAVDMDNYYYQNDEEKAEAQGRLAQDIADTYGFDVNNQNAMREALQDIVLTNPEAFKDLKIDLKNATGDELMELVLGVGSNGKPEDDNIYFSSNTLTLKDIAKAEDGSAKSDEQIKSDITNAIANQYGISAEQLMTSAAGKNILNTIMLDHENDEYFKGVNITSEEDVMKALVAAAKDGKLDKVRTADTSVSFLNSKDYDDDKLQEKALEKTDSYISYLSVKDNEVKSTDLGQKAGEQPTYMDLLSQVQYEMDENGDSVSLKDAIDSAATKLEDAQKGTDEAAIAQAQKEFDSLTELGKSAIQQLAETNPYLFANLYDTNGNLDVNNLGEEGLNAKIQNPVDKDSNELKEYDITLQAITYMIPENEPEPARQTPPPSNSVPDVPKSTPQSVPESTPESVPESTPESVPEEPTPEPSTPVTPTPTPTPEPSTPVTPTPTPESTPVTSEPGPESTPVTSDPCTSDPDTPTTSEPTTDSQPPAQSEPETLPPCTSNPDTPTTSEPIDDSQPPAQSTPEVESQTEVESTPEVESQTEVESTPEVESQTEVESTPDETSESLPYVEGQDDDVDAADKEGKLENQGVEETDGDGEDGDGEDGDGEGGDGEGGDGEDGDGEDGDGNYEEPQQESQDEPQQESQDEPQQESQDEPDGGCQGMGDVDNNNDDTEDNEVENKPEPKVERFEDEYGEMQ